MEPMVINAVQKLLCSDQAAEAVAEQAVMDRAADPDYALSDEEQRQLRWQVLRVGAAAVPLVALLEGAVQRTPWVVVTAHYPLYETYDTELNAVRGIRLRRQPRQLLLRRQLPLRRHLGEMAALRRRGASAAAADAGAVDG